MIFKALETQRLGFNGSSVKVLYKYRIIGYCVQLQDKHVTVLPELAERG